MKKVKVADFEIVTQTIENSESEIYHIEILVEQNTGDYTIKVPGFLSFLLCNTDPDLFNQLMDKVSSFIVNRSIKSFNSQGN